MSERIVETGRRWADAASRGRPIEFVCDICLHSIRSYDTDPRPRCPRGHGVMTPDSDEPQSRPALLPRSRRGL